MRHLIRFTLPVAAVVVTAIASAESHNPADYPLRIHVYGRNQTTFYHNRQAEEAKGEGRANLFENGTPKGVDFQFECDHKLQTSSGYETYPAKWKKPGAELVILQPEFGKPNSYDTCRLKVMVKDFVYVMRNGSMATEPATVFADWMKKHEYDPEHGKNIPAQAAGAAAPPVNTAPAQPAPTGVSQ